MDTFFGVHLPSNTIAGMSLALLLSVLLGGFIGLERELHAHPAGLRTHILVCLGSCLMTLVSTNMGHGSNDRIAAQIVSGVGFLGAGAIIRDGASVRGLTTAASIWGTAGVGIALGTSPYFGQLAVIATVIILFTLWVLNWIEDWLEDHGIRALLLTVEVQDTPEASARVVEQVSRCGARVQSVSVESGKDPGTRLVTMRVALNSKVHRAAVFKEVSHAPGVVQVHLS